MYRKDSEGWLKHTDFIVLDAKLYYYIQRLGSIMHDASAVDLFKCIFAICVVAIHTMAFKDHGESAYFAFTYCITSFAVPYFFVCSGYFLGRKIYRKDLQKSDYR